MGKFSVVKGDIVKSKTDAIVNAANTSLLVHSEIPKFLGLQLRPSAAL